LLFARLPPRILKIIRTYQAAFSFAASKASRLASGVPSIHISTSVPRIPEINFAISHEGRRVPDKILEIIASESLTLSANSDCFKLITSHELKSPAL
jgi:hypothetical protein